MKSLGFGSITILSVLVMSAIAILPSSAFASSGPSCESLLFSDTTLTGDIGPCSANGLHLDGNGMTLDCAGHTISGTGQAGAGLVSAGFTGITIKNCHVTGFYQGIYTDGASGDVISNNNLDGNTIGIFLQRSTGNTVTGNIADGNGQLGIWMGYQATGNRVTGNAADSNGQSGFYDITSGSGTSGTGNTYSGNTCNSNTESNSSPNGLCASSSYSETFAQNGIPSSGISWGVTVGSAHYTGTSPSITVSGLSGTASYSYDSPVSGTAGASYTCSLGCSGSVSASGTVSATYTPQYLLTLATSPSGLTPSPTASPISSSGYYDSGTAVTLTANTVPGYIFIDWQVDGTSQTLFANTASVTMNSPHAATAVYQTPSDALQTLILTVNGMNLPHGIANSLDAKLNAAQDSLERGNNNAASSQLGAFVNEVSAQDGKTISTSQAGQLESLAQEIINSIP